MANAYKIVVGDMVDYMSTPARGWRVAKVTAVTSQTSLTLAWKNQDGTVTSIGATIPKWNRAVPRASNVWRPY